MFTAGWGPIIPLLSYNFLHGDWLHLIGNMWALWLFGDNVEDQMGPLRFLAFYLTTGVIAGIIHVIFNPGSSIPTIGGSGAIAGLMGAYFLMYPTSKILTIVPLFFIPLFLEIPAVIYLAIWLFTQIYAVLHRPESGAVSNIAWTAHVGGFAAGFILHRLFFRPRVRRRY
jgi:membrane associated rhomboid family serine protease